MSAPRDEPPRREAPCGDATPARSDEATAGRPHDATPGPLHEATRGRPHDVAGSARAGAAITLLSAAPREDVSALAAALCEAGREIMVVSAPAGVRRLDPLFRLRAFEDHVAAVPFTRRALRAARPSLAHAFTLADAFAAAREGVPLVLSFTAPVARETVAARRLRFKFLKAALEAATATTAPDEAVAASAERWLGITPHVLDPRRDAAGFITLYDEVTHHR